MSNSDKDLYFVAGKVFLEHDGKFLILKDSYGHWDIPGGRIEKDQFRTPLAGVIKHKMSEEVGDDVRYTVHEPIVLMRHEREEQVNGNPMARIFAVGYRAIYDGGEIHLSPRHTEMLWADIATFKPEEYFTGGWLEGVHEYLELSRR